MDRTTTTLHTVNNAAVTAAGLLWGNDDYTTTVGLTVQGGWDTDSDGATAGSVAGTVLGAAALPAPFHRTPCPATN
jgi:ADP-ribosylglycohydrolase